MVARQSFVVVVYAEGTVTPRHTLAHQLRIQFELPPDRPTDAELDLIIEDVARFVDQHGVPPSAEEWRLLTLERVNFDGSYFYKGLNFQDLNTLPAVIRSQAQPTRR
jgi:hypothetical protein